VWHDLKKQTSAKVSTYPTMILQHVLKWDQAETKSNADPALRRTKCVIQSHNTWIPTLRQKGGLSESTMKMGPQKCSLEPTKIHDVIILMTLILVLSAVTTFQIKCLLYFTMQRSGLGQGTCSTRVGAIQKQIWVSYACADFKW